jgi:glycosyltransferase involved in cell wall biosynthesis
MASGLPVVSTLVGGVPELVGREEGILVAPGDPAVLAGALEQVMAGPDRYDRAAIAARAASRYGLEAIGSRLTDIYASVLAERRERDGVRASAAAR